MDLDIIIVSETSQTQRDEYHDVTYVWNLKKMIQMNLRNRNTVTDVENKLMATRQERGGEGYIGRFRWTYTHHYM